MASTQGVPAGTLSSVPEEERQGSEVQSGDLRGTKRSRGAESGDNVDVEMADSAADVAGAGAGTLEGVHRAKRRVVDANAAPPPPRGAPASVPAPQPGSARTPAATGTKLTTKDPSSSKPSSSSNNNKLDTDENFLKAVNSMKRGKKHEDEFDREFNQLRIAKPRKADAIGSSAVAAAATTTTKGVPEAVVAPWDAIDDFGDIGIRGNFMVVVEMDIQRGGSAKLTPSARTDDAAHPEWIGKPNFKKFKMVRTFYSHPYFFSTK